MIPDPTKPQSLPAPPVTLRVLVVDDDEGVHIQLRQLMKIPPPANVEIISAFTIDQAYIAIRESAPNVILLDLNLSALWPAERTLHEIEALDKASGVPVITFSGMEPDELWPMSVKFYGAYNFFAKSDCLKPTFRGQLLKDITNAIFLYSRIHRLSQPHGPQA
jgi:DNA-binding NarL/FixJ family response regulator